MPKKQEETESGWVKVSLQEYNNISHKTELAQSDDGTRQGKQSDETTRRLFLLVLPVLEHLLLLTLPLLELPELGLAECLNFAFLLLALCTVLGEFLYPYR